MQISGLKEYGRTRAMGESGECIAQCSRCQFLCQEIYRLISTTTRAPPWWNYLPQGNCMHTHWQIHTHCTRTHIISRWLIGTHVHTHPPNIWSKPQKLTQYYRLRTHPCQEQTTIKHTIVFLFPIYSSRKNHGMIFSIDCITPWPHHRLRYSSSSHT